ncbi:tudor and KH domain-containing protein homolog isoform X1 [Drosophila gunungcola]|uniref:tudor and KH domain-containing protein homolog isoform X1 n=1 Tax=Drosophila gunungcola TaxID=103775 RepID=UPI0022E618F6|nr:tudor and KH domain-containing protein homolog isoform X1 [Drosophila gunungcola]XP_052852911.1 tudor and KH domain-containing protein homolog isoform X1 [Drosophila gunungcola]XP_052852912.1 tudor and KH domain-containing protein homolog isoform X1 [Drosophila gunungcola]XP_052852913.1 tudor and KH domain-containing protein homolog isoform X1 [Drosophila gunungcola]XP_052852914.1 tudor and KH domain-containing protein homolog isoform X1 [Drosophila gunungcola]
MLRNTPFGATPTYKLLLGLGLCSLGGAMLYAYFKTRDDEEETDSNDRRQQISGQEAPEQKPQKEVCLKIIVDNEHVPLIMGRGGSNIKLIEEKTQAKIRLRDKDNGHKFCDISGLPDAVKAARVLLIKEIERAPMVKLELQVPQRLASKLNGRGGELIQEIRSSSLAKLNIDPNGRNGKAKITIVGNQKQVNIARKLLDDQIEEDEELLRSMEEVEQRREPRRSPTNSIASSSLYSSQTSLSSHTQPRDKLMAAKGEGKPMEVYVSAVASPTKFWVQLIGPQSKKLDNMVQEMTSYYSSAENRAKHVLTAPYVGQIVAAVFKFDEKWYRAEIVDIMPNQYNPKEQVIDLYFVDYGDSEYISPADICELRTDFLTLRFQAVECFLANVKSTIQTEPITWPKSSIAKFEDLTEVAHWRKLIARVVTYKERPKSTTAVNSAAKEGTPLPGVELFDPADNAELNIGDLMITQGFALPLDDSYPLRSRSSTPSTNSDSTIEELCVSNPVTPLTPHSPMSMSIDVDSITQAEDEHLAQQLQHLQHKLNGNNIGTTNAIKLTATDLENGNNNDVSTTNGSGTL